MTSGTSGWSRAPARSAVSPAGAIHPDRRRRCGRGSAWPPPRRRPAAAAGARPPAWRSGGDAARLLRRRPARRQSHRDQDQRRAAGREPQRGCSRSSSPMDAAQRRLCGWTGRRRRSTPPSAAAAAPTTRWAEAGSRSRCGRAASPYARPLRMYVRRRLHGSGLRLVAREPRRETNVNRQGQARLPRLDGAQPAGLLRLAAAPHRHDRRARSQTPPHAVRRQRRAVPLLRRQGPQGGFRRLGCQVYALACEPGDGHPHQGRAARDWVGNPIMRNPLTGHASR